MNWFLKCRFHFKETALKIFNQEAKYVYNALKLGQWADFMMKKLALSSRRGKTCDQINGKGAKFKAPQVSNVMWSHFQHKECNLHKIRQWSDWSHFFHYRKKVKILLSKLDSSQHYFSPICVSYMWSKFLLQLTWKLKGGIIL